jgi:putative ABC transport system substrate-binding protein
MRRREFITLVGAAMWPFAARAQQSTGARRIGVLMNFRSDAPEGQARVAPFMQALQKLGWKEGDNVRIEIRWAEDDIERYRKFSEELVQLSSDVILASASPGVTALQRITRSVPIVFANVVDPVGAGYVTQPGAARRQHDRIYCVRIQHRREMARVTQTDCAARDADSGPSRSGLRHLRPPTR